MERIIVYGMGEEFKRHKENILRMFEVVACTDSYKEPSNEWEKEYYIQPYQISEIEFDKILISSARYQDAIGINLIKNGFRDEQMIFLEDILRGKLEDNYMQAYKDMKEYETENKSGKFKVQEDSLLLIMDEKNQSAGKPYAHYFPQDIWAARKVYLNNPSNHYDIGSSLNGFIAHLLVFREVNYIDIRPLDLDIPGLRYLHGDAVDLGGALGEESIESLSSLSVMEHFGLGRYGDPIDPDAYIKAAKSMQCVLKKEGHLYLSVPVGPEDKLVFNAHRIFRIATVINLFDQCRLADMVVASPTGAWFYPVCEKDYEGVEEYSCGMFEFVKQN